MLENGVIETTTLGAITTCLAFKKVREMAGHQDDNRPKGVNPF
jgi:hypothetical protein